MIINTILFTWTIGRVVWDMDLNKLFSVVIKALTKLVLPPPDGEEIMYSVPGILSVVLPRHPWV